MSISPSPITITSAWPRWLALVSNTATVSARLQNRDSESEQPRTPGAGQAVPGRRDRQHEAGEDDQSPGKLRKDDVDREECKDCRARESPEGG